jgi:SAM-dependent methyltransferase
MDAATQARPAKNLASFGMTGFDRLVRRLVPSVAVLSRRRGLMRILDVISRIFAAPFPEFRDLPPNHMRIRVGVGNRLLFNEAHYLKFGTTVLVRLLDRGALDLDSDVVDLGSGCGRFAGALQRHGFRGTYTGVDVDREMVDWCNRHFPSDQYRFELADVYSEVYNPNGRRAPNTIPCADASQDLVVAYSVLSHLLEDDVVGYLRESCRVLRPGGTILMGAFCMEDMAALGELGGRWTFPYREGRAYLQNRRYPEAAVAYHREDLLTWLREAGFSTVSVEPERPQSLLVATR